ncbi:multiple epidermal growth factor-like domains protein 6 [Haliotis asinina]|uniref:multiple epidermal growth factor-like domains protein 6 n=1 Tax=Haliotis asinina TaxID=109174 RepID=UPI003531ED4F
MSHLLQILVTAYIVIYSQGAKCPGSHHCSECDEQTGLCKTKCHRGYFGLTCQDVCNRRCRYHTCELVPDKGIERCTDGCIPGFQGLTCHRPCDTHHTGCTRCPGGCDGEYCQVSGVCFSGCRDSYYGAGCKACSSRCKSCNRITGTCELCHPPYSGAECGHSCENCVGGCESGCTQGCRHGFYGDDCKEACSDTCRPNPSLAADGLCPDRESCPPECHSQSGECFHGCVDGWYGPQCSRRCSSNCQHQRCNRSGACAAGCEHHVSPCEGCLEQCVNLTCVSSNTSCSCGCNNSTSGCGLSCNGVVTNSSDYNITSCRYNCTHNSSSPDCPPGACGTNVSVINTETVKYVVLAVICILAASLCGWCCYRRGLSTNRIRYTADEVMNAGQTDVLNSGYMALHLYEDVREGDVTIQLPGQSQGGTSTEDVTGADEAIQHPGQIHRHTSSDECRQHSLSEVSLD